jgi:hypothetical protein
MEKITILIVANSSLSILRNSQFSSVVKTHGDLQKQNNNQIFVGKVFTSICPPVLVLMNQNIVQQ